MQELPPRPFGLVLLTGLSFGIAVWNLLAAGQIFVVLVTGGATPGITAAVLHSLMALPRWAPPFLVVAGALKAGLLFVAAWGYFNFRRLGRIAGSAYAAVSLAESAIVALALDYPVGLTSLIGILFALFTLLAVNGPFRALLRR
jgi:hypothetical protein